VPGRGHVEQILRGGELGVDRQLVDGSHAGPEQSDAKLGPEIVVPAAATVRARPHIM
jgi:hypothetical protein